MARWLEEYQFDIVHHAGIKHRNADAMSRRPSCTWCTRAECFSNLFDVSLTRETEPIPVAVTT